MGLCIFDIDDLSFCLKFPVFQDERHVAVLGIVADVGDADTVAASPGGSAGAGGGGDAGGKLGGHGVGCSKSRKNPMLKLRDFGLVKLLAFNA